MNMLILVEKQTQRMTENYDVSFYYLSLARMNYIFHSKVLTMASLLLIHYAMERGTSVV